MGLMAHFTPEAWVNDQAIEVDAQGPQEWDCTAHFATLSEAYRAELLAEIDKQGGALDGHDALFSDPAAPEWVRQHRGPFTIRISHEES